MIEPLRLAIAATFGLVVGAAYFWVLWRSVRAIASSNAPWRAALKGGGLRLALLCGCFAVLVLMGAKALELIAWLVGFLTVRFFTIKRSRLPETPAREPSQ